MKCELAPIIFGLAFGRTDVHLHSHFHWNPYSMPEENAARAAARLHREKPEL